MVLEAAMRLDMLRRKVGKDGDIANPIASWRCWTMPCDGSRPRHGGNPHPPFGAAGLYLTAAKHGHLAVVRPFLHAPP